MESGLIIGSIWEDEDLFKVRIVASNGGFSGVAECYTTRPEIAKLASMLEGYPNSLGEEVDFSTGRSETLSYFSLHFITAGLGHVLVKVIISQSKSCIPQEMGYSEFSIVAEPSSIDRFVKSLGRLALEQV